MTKTKIQQTAKREYIPLEPLSPPSTIEGRPASTIALECMSRAAYAVKHKEISQESLVKSFQNGISKGYINGLKAALLFIQQHQGTGYTIPELASSLANFLEESINEQIQGS